MLSGIERSCTSANLWLASLISELSAGIQLKGQTPSLNWWRTSPIRLVAIKLNIAKLFNLRGLLGLSGFKAISSPWALFGHRKAAKRLHLASAIYSWPSDRSSSHTLDNHQKIVFFCCLLIQLEGRARVFDIIKDTTNENVEGSSSLNGSQESFRRLRSDEILFIKINCEHFLSTQHQQDATLSV